MKKKMSHIAAITGIAALFLVGCSSTPEVTEAPTDNVAEAVVEEEAEEPAAEVGMTRENPAPLGTEIADGDWKVVINQVDLDATDRIDPEWNEPAADGNVYIMVEATVTYIGDNPQGDLPWALIDYVTADGNTVDLAFVSYDDEDFTLLDPLYKDASHTGWNAYEVPDTLDGVLAVTPDMTSEKVFVAIK